MPKHALAELRAARYVLLRSFRRDGTPIDTPIWFGLDGDALLFRTKMGPKTRRLATRRDVELAACDYRGRVHPGATPAPGRQPRRRRLPGPGSPRRDDRRGPRHDPFGRRRRAGQPGTTRTVRLAVEHCAADQSAGRDQRPP